MSNTKDDPREVLAILNSLGFIGITAPQLKAFMKDLKIYKKIKEHERQQHKEEIRKKILKKQQQMVQEILSEHSKELSGKTNDNSNSSSFDNDSLIKVKIRCIPKDSENLQQKYIKSEYNVPSKEEPKWVKMKHKKTDFTPELNLDRKGYDRIDSKFYLNVQRSKNDNHSTVTTCSMQNVYNANYDINKVSQESSDTKHSKPVKSDYSRPISAPNILEHDRKARSKSISSDPSTAARSQSLPRTKTSSCSTQKSFIRPWRLHLEVQKSITNKKCDPVALYQKYHEEWKQISLPGEAKHMSLRWAVREKMLGSDPHPPPLPKKSASVPILRKK
ncbi:hypothetical protein KPH14_012109 [Odynerus spinipes]|uniref:Centriolar and ciliogenesis-associated protein HYLS1 C-terminal domain-containing protein n=1 Tax=Odynerus spinipes TaxID=1348599 RepID=A0AAD9VJ79_9HYME|nr:hypothetical protein KPH14_012109 [Odynerus spinipes]